MRKRGPNIAASVRARLLNLARERGQSMDLLLTRYALECLLHRLSLSAHRERFVLKGAILLTTWIQHTHRTTRDVDLLGFGDSEPEAILTTFRDICRISVADGVDFDANGMQVDLIREDLEYGGVRLRTTAALAGARIAVVVDIGFGDAVEPGIEDIELPLLLDMQPLRLRAYPRETVIAEKFQAMTVLGRANSRMKDFYDVWILLNTYEFDTDRLRNAIAATFERRKTALPSSPPDAFTADFSQDASKQRQWAAFTRDLALAVPPLETVVDDLANRLMPIVTTIATSNSRGT
jgi:predicted nucleotidyltransferase component of viral defense system